MTTHSHDSHKMATKVIHAAQHPDPQTGAVAPPIYQTSTFAFESAAQGAARFAGTEPGYIYTRIGNPTTATLEENVAILEGGAGGLATASGMAAVSTTLLALLSKGDHMIGTDAVYGPSRVVVEREFARFGIESDFLDTADLGLIEKHIKPNTKVLYVETPANPTIKLTDIEACAKLAHDHDMLLIVDNTFASPILQRPLELGADIVIHSMTKFLNGHSDVVAGMVVPKTEELLKKIAGMLKLLGGTMDPHQAWLVLRGVKTLQMRVLKGQENALKLARLLENHPAVEWVRYPGLESHPQYALARKQMDGPGSLISFELKGGTAAGAKLLETVTIPVLAVSLGGVESLIQHPASMTHAAMPREERIEAGITDGLVRLSVGCEDLDDLEADFTKALDALL